MTIGYEFGVPKQGKCFGWLQLSESNLESIGLDISSYNDMHGMFQARYGYFDYYQKAKVMQLARASNTTPYDWRQFVVIDDSNFQTAVNLWFDNPAEALSTYGHGALDGRLRRTPMVRSLVEPLSMKTTVGRQPKRKAFL